MTKVDIQARILDLEKELVEKTTEMNSKKLFINGSFGKFGSAYSVLYSPRLMIQVTITGQLALLMLIETLELAGIPVVSANTDGIVIKCPREKLLQAKVILHNWEEVTGFDTEETRYRSLHSRDVNNYIAITESGKVKLKGAFAEPGLQKNPTTQICVDAAIAFLKDGTPIEQTIRECEDITKFVTIRQVNGGGEKDGEFLGKAVRWYYADGETGTIKYKTNGNTVARSEGARPLMMLPDYFPSDIDYEWYEREARGILDDIGISGNKYGSVEGRSGIVMARLPDAKNIHYVNIAEGNAVCGKRPGGPRVRWIEFERMPIGHRVCPKCVNGCEL